MPLIGFHASHEQVDPRSLLQAVQWAEAAGFGAAMSSDHFSPWSARQGQSGFAWSWLGAALHATSLPFGVVNAPGQRYHPAIIAQAAGGDIRREGSDAVPSGGYRRSVDEAYVDRGASPLIIEDAERLTDPDRTLAQGTVIQAALQTAINSDLPGNVVAVVSEPVPAFSGDAVLVPRGSRLFGQYRAGAELNQKRILVLWTRILTPDGTSMEIASVAGDPLGRSGLAGDVDTEFDERFGGAALVSLIGAAPALASRSSGDVVVAGTLENVGDDLGDASETAVARQLDIAPTIRLGQGETVTVLVDRDVVIR